MGNVVEAQIFKRASHGERETVRMRLYALDGTPCNMDKLYEEGGEPAAPANPWLTAVHRAQIDLSDTGAPLVELPITIGDSGMALVHASAMFWVQSNNAYCQVKFDNKELGTGVVSNFNPVVISLLPPVGSGASVDMKVVGGVPPGSPTFAPPGQMVIAEPGDHILQFNGWGDFATNAFAKEIRLAAMPL